MDNSIFPRYVDMVFTSTDPGNLRCRQLQHKCTMVSPQMGQGQVQASVNSRTVTMFGGVQFVNTNLIINQHTVPSSQPKNGSNHRPGGFYLSWLVLTNSAHLAKINQSSTEPQSNLAPPVTASQPSSQLLSIRPDWARAGLGCALWNYIWADWGPDVTQGWHDLTGWVDLASPHWPVLISGSKSARNIDISVISDPGLRGTTVTFLTANQQKVSQFYLLIILERFNWNNSTALMMFGIYCNRKFCNLMKIYLLSLYLSIKVNFTSDPIR